MPRAITKNMNASAYLLASNFSYIQIPQGNGFPLFSNTGYSIAGRFWWYGAANVKTLYAEAPSSGASQLFYIAVDPSTSKLLVLLRNNSNVAQIPVVSSTTTVSTNGWHDFVWTDNNGVCSLYIDGVKDPIDFSYTPAGAYSFDRSAIGAITRGSILNYFSGYLSDFNAYNRVLTASEATAFHSGVVPTQNLRGSWRLDEGTSANGAIDSSGNGNTGTYPAGMFYSPNVPFGARNSTAINRVFNGDFSMQPSPNAPTTVSGRWIDGTSGGGASNVYGWRLAIDSGAINASIDNGMLKIENTDATAAGYVDNGNNQSTQIPIQPLVSYLLSFRMKVDRISGTGGVGARIEYTTFSAAGQIVSSSTPAVTATQDWVTYNIPFIAQVGAVSLRLRLRSANYMTVYYDDVKLMQVDNALSILRSDPANLVYNGDFEYAPPFIAATTSPNRWIDGTAAGSNINSQYGWGLLTATGSVSAMFDTAEKSTGARSLKLSIMAAGGLVQANSTPNASAGDKTYFSSVIPVLPLTSYTLTFKMKTNYVSGSASGAFIALRQRTADYGSAMGDQSTTAVPTTTDWTTYSITITTVATTRFLNIRPTINGTGGAGTLVMDAWYDNIELRRTDGTGSRVVVS